LGGVLFGGPALAPVQERNRHLGDVDGDSQGGGQTQHHSDDDAHNNGTTLTVFHCFEFLPPCGYILRGAPTPSTANPLCNTWAVAATRASRACRSFSSSTRMRSAS